MDHLSLYARLRALVEANVITLERNPVRHLFEGEGRFKYNGDTVEILANYVGPCPDGVGEAFTTPHDVAWVPSKKIFISSGKSENEPFVPIKTRPVYRVVVKPS